jgi:hypothetical protein
VGEHDGTLMLNLIAIWIVKEFLRFNNVFKKQLKARKLLRKLIKGKIRFES